MKRLGNALEAFTGCKKRTYFLVYTVLFLALAGLVYLWHILARCTLIWKGDGWSQHFKALVYFAKYLRAIFRDLLAGRGLVIPEWDFAIGEGSDILQTLHYYVIGDPIMLLSALVPTAALHWFYSLAAVLRMYLAGLAFSALAFGTERENRYGVLAGALSYAFCFWAIRVSARHPYFANPMIYFPLILLGIEKILRGRRPYLFILSVAVAGVSSFYFFYMIAILAALYALIRLGFACRGDLRGALAALVRLALYAVVGACLAGVILAPVMKIFLGDTRMASGQTFAWLYPLSYYSALPSMLSTGANSYWLCMGYSAPVIVAVFALVVNRGRGLLKALLGVCAVFVLFPVFGWALNGMTYTSNRWCWALSLLCATILTAKWDELLSMSGAGWRRTLVCCAAYFAACLLFEKSREVAAITAAALILLALLIAKDSAGNPLKRPVRQALLVLLVFASVFSIAYWRFSPDTEAGFSEMMTISAAGNEAAMFDNEAAAVKAISDEAYPRYSGVVQTPNANMINGVSSTQYRWSISNSFLNDYRAALEMRDHNFSLTDYDDRTVPTTLSAVGYYIGKKHTALPFGFTEVDAQRTEAAGISTAKYALYENQHALPLGYCYDRYVTREAWEAMDAVQKQQVQLTAALVDEAPAGLAACDEAPLEYEVPYTVECQGGVVQTETGFVTTGKDATVTLSFEGVKRAETYLEVGGIEFVPTPEYDLYFGGEDVDPLNRYGRKEWDALPYTARHDIAKAKRYWDPDPNPEFTVTDGGKVKKTFQYRQPDAAFSFGRHDFIVNLGYKVKPINAVTLTLPKRGVYTFERLKVYCVPMKGYTEKIDRLRENVLEDVKLDTDRITGSLRLDEAKLLCVAVPYSEGWRATIDGEAAPVLLTNARYLGLSVPAGEHAIAFVYERPYQKLGYALTAAGLAALIAVIVVQERKRRRQARA